MNLLFRNGGPVFNAGVLVFVPEGSTAADCVCCEPVVETCCEWTQCPDAIIPNDTPFTLWGGIAGSGLTPYIFSSLCDPGPPIIYRWNFTGVADSFEVRCEDGAFTLTYSCPSAPFSISYNLTVVSCVPFIAHAVVNIVHSSGEGDCDINLVGDFYILEDPLDLP